MHVRSFWVLKSTRFCIVNFTKRLLKYHQRRSPLSKVEASFDEKITVLILVYLSPPLSRTGKTQCHQKNVYENYFESQIIYVCILRSLSKKWMNLHVYLKGLGRVRIPYDTLLFEKVELRPYLGFFLRQILISELHCEILCAIIFFLPKTVFFGWWPHLRVRIPYDTLFVKVGPIFKFFEGIFRFLTSQGFQKHSRYTFVWNFFNCTVYYNEKQTWKLFFNANFFCTIV